MRSIIVVLTVLTAMSATYAKSYPDNPDRFTSITFMAGIDGGSGEYKYTSVGYTEYKQDLKPNGFGASAMLTTPISDNMSFIINSSFSSSINKYEENYYFYGTESNYTLFSFNIGFKIYIK